MLIQLSNELEQTQKRQRSTPIEWMTVQHVSGGVKRPHDIVIITVIMTKYYYNYY